ncbi:Zinc finger protein 830 [Triplophysa tibetana]|uniref:Zinc finger protein 830 n=1 Tax=Triplophysa tibetana TaxID=1572043 RepID=A0A5A9P956_9TELE|nr:Zinc finger protein 830 [Triplophysa tibetana]
MASVKKGKKVVNQEELRRLMRAKTTSAERQKRVDSPYAKYNSAGQLSCALCNAPIKSALLWQTHVLGKQHRDKAAEVKSRDQTAQTSTSSSAAALKRKAKPELATAPAKQAKHHNTAGAASGHQVSSNQSAGLGILAGNYDDGEGDMDTSRTNPAKDAAANLPADFFDSSGGGVPASGPGHSGSVSKASDDEETVQERKDKATEALPEGFFDDPVRDAKVRNVDTPKDQMDKEWEEFQKEMRQVNSASDAIVAEDDEEGRLERQIDEIDEQIQCYRRVELLRAKQEVVKEALVKKRKDQRNQTQSSASDEEDEEELMHVLTQDWRAKGALA